MDEHEQREKSYVPEARVLAVVLARARIRVRGVSVHALAVRELKSEHARPVTYHGEERGIAAKLRWFRFISFVGCFQSLNFYAMKKKKNNKKCSRKAYEMMQRGNAFKTHLDPLNNGRVHRCTSENDSGTCTRSKKAERIRSIEVCSDKATN
jgi:hypothetical protein